ncbi:MAG TPA: hypothetical protein VFX25_26070 [Streptosporangiaceae bacterium]|nr:hypothetical protein [Streptosporangiaceae bacterium]
MTRSRDPGDPADRDPVVNRADVTKVLHRAGLPPDVIGTMLDGVEFPDRLSHVAARLESIGVTKERLMDRMGAGQ